MSKKKNTLKDLDDFLKQQAATLVQPASLSDQLEEKVQEPVKKVAEVKPPVQEQPGQEIESEKLLNDLRAFGLQEGQAFRKKFYDLIIKSIESQSESLPEDKMLINTALYLKSGDAWKEVIRNYWKNK
ncbi:MAG TPA: hypothetical protein VGK59_23600 [Ohtaekwangia sp.]